MCLPVYLPTFPSLSISLSISVSIYNSILFVCLSAYLPTSVYLYLYLSIDRSIYLFCYRRSTYILSICSYLLSHTLQSSAMLSYHSVCVCVMFAVLHLSYPIFPLIHLNYLSIYLSIYSLSVCPSIYLSVHLSIYPSIYVSLSTTA